MIEQPEFIGSYKILKKLGQGGFATVYLAQNGSESENRLVALKALSSPESYARFQREIETVAKLDHPNIIRIFDTGEFERMVTLSNDNGSSDKSDSAEETPSRLGKIFGGLGWGGQSKVAEPDAAVAVSEPVQAMMPYFTMEYIAGGTLRDMLEAKGRLTRDEAVMLIKQVGAALTYAHTQGIIHRDVNPNNVLLDTNQHPPRPILTDFGMVKPITPDEDNLTVTVGLIGTFHYYAPEQWSKAPLTPATDLYALAITFFEILSGRRPFKGDIFKLRDKHLNDPLPPLSSMAPQIGPFFDDVLFKATAKAAEERYVTVDDFIVALEQANQRADYDEKYREVKWLIGQEEYAIALEHLETVFIEKGEYQYRDVARLFWGLVYVQQHGQFPPEWSGPTNPQTKPFEESTAEIPPAAIEPAPSRAIDTWHEINRYLLPLLVGMALLIGAGVSAQIPANFKTSSLQLVAFGLLVLALFYYIWIYYIAPHRNS